MGVNRTAVMTAALRATETARTDRLFDDPLAALFVAAARAGGTEPVQLPPGSSEFAAIRTRFYDDQAATSCAAGIRQVVLLAAGLDARAFRLDWPDGVRLFEVDLPETFAVKEAVLATAGAVARCPRATVAADLRGDWIGALDAAGFDTTRPTAWLAEGLLPYLADEDSRRLLATVTAASAPGSRFAFDHIDRVGADRPGVRATVDAIRAAGARLMSTVESPVGWLTGHGWRAAVSRVPALGERYGRPLPGFVDLASSDATALVAAAR
jgi:methyltransferase (TIGR00027 family)